MRNFSKLNIDLHGHTSGHVKTFCPFCHDRRHDKRDKSLSVDIDKGLYKCHYCDAQGYVPDEDEERRKEERRRRREERQKQLPRNNGFVRPKDPLPSPLKEDDTNPQHQQVIGYLTQQRGLTIQTLNQLRVSIAPPSAAGGRPGIQFNYFDRGIFINQKTRTLDKQFRFIVKAELIPYNIDAILRKEVCYITEGEFDTITLVQCGFEEAISVPNGSQKNLTFLDRFVETHFDDKQLIVLALDNDPKGEELKNELLRRLGEERCRVVEWSADCKDANEELVKHGADSVIAHVNNAKEIPLTGIQTVADVENQLDELFRNGKQHGAQIKLHDFDRQITFETGRYMVVTGRPGDGKSEFVDEMCLRLALLHDWRVAYFSPENTPITYHLAKLCEKLTGYAFQQKGRMTWSLYEGCKRWISQNVCHVLPGTDIDPTIDEFNADYQRAIEDKTERYTLPLILDKARQAISRRGVRVVVIDPLNNIEPEPGMEDLKWDRHVNAELRRFARKYHCLVILVAHPRKVNRVSLDGKKRRVEMNDINGSADFGNMSDYCLCVDRDDELKVVSIYVDKVKFKHLGTRGVAFFHYDELSGRYVPCSLERVPNATGTKFNKTADWRNFNIRWVNEGGEAVLRSQLDRFEDADENGGQMSLF